MSDPDVIVIGAGVMGAATARALAQAGREVVLIERFSVGHTNGSSHGSARIFRLSYADPTYVAMGERALPSWRVLEQESGETLLNVTGAFSVGENVDALRAARVPLSDARPPKTVTLDESYVYEPGAGVIAAERVVHALLDGALNAGASLRENERVTAVGETKDGVTVETDRSVFRARCVVVTAGPWAAPLLAEAGITLNVRPTRETVSYFRIAEPPPVLIDWRAPLTYALPTPEGLLKAGEHIAGPAASPDEPGEPDKDSVQRVSSWVARRFPGADPSPVRSETCFYTNTSDEHFVLERHGKIVVGSACSGHGFKFAPLVGARLASLASES